MTSEVKEYFERVALKYSRSDVEHLLRTKAPCAAPLLAVTANGIDLIGGMCFGFKSPEGKDNGKRRSVDFMVKYMGVDSNVATVLYTSVRCGIVHQGMPKFGFMYFVDHERPKKDRIVYRDGSFIWLNVTEFAHSYLSALSAIEADPSKHVQHLPPPRTTDEHDFLSAFASIADEIEDYNRTRFALTGSHADGTISTSPSPGMMKDLARLRPTQSPPTANPPAVSFFVPPKS